MLGYDVTRVLVLNTAGLEMDLLQLAVTWYMLEGKLPTGTSFPLGHPKQSDFIRINLNFLCFGCPSGQLALQHVPFDH